ncbi:MAG: glycosyltransferase family 39 protein [Acidobacteriia bacterium]|nr:glycosyltransferase family 39 protein [Terriglobia bacterium]
MIDESVPQLQRSRTWFLAGLVVVFLRALPNLRYPLGRDQATYCVIGQGLLHGQLLYRDLWDNKPPGIFYVYALIVKIFGPVMWCVGVVDILWLLVISCCIFYFARRYLGTPAATLAIVFNAARHCRQGYIHAAQPETFLMLCVFAAWFLLCGSDPSPALVPRAPSPQGRGLELKTRRMPALSLGERVASVASQVRGFFSRGQGWTLRVIRYFAAGLLLGAAFWLKYNAIAFFPFVVLLPFLDFRELDRGSGHVRLEIPWRDWFVRALIVGAGFLLAVVGVLAYFWVSGAWPAMKEVQFEVLPRYGAKVFHWSFYFVLWALWQTQNHMGIWNEVMPALTLLFAWKRRELGLVAPVLLLAFAGYVSVVMQGRFHPYYFETCFPFFAMFWGYVSVKTYEGFKYLQRVFAQRGWTLARAMLWLVLAGLAFSLLPEESVRVVQQYEFLADWWRDPELSYKTYWWELPLEKLGEQLRVIDYLKKNSDPRDEVYVWGTAPLINFRTQRRNPSRFVSNLALISTWAPERWHQELVRILEAKRPRYIVVARHDSVPTLTFTRMDSEEYLQVYPALADLLKRQYQLDVNYWDFEIYRLK